MEFAEDCFRDEAPETRWEVWVDYLGNRSTVQSISVNTRVGGSWYRYGDDSGKSGNLKSLLTDIQRGSACRHWAARVEINGQEIPYLTTVPDEGQTVSCPDLVAGGVFSVTWDGSDEQVRMLGQKLLHSTSEEAKLHYQALTSF
jgi:hypothetical protein